MPWEIFMGSDYTMQSSPFSSYLRWGESLGWGTLILSFYGGVKSLGILVGTLTPDLINPWLILIASTVTGGTAVGLLAYSRIQRARLEGETLEAIYAANNIAIRAGKVPPWPAFLPKGALTATVTTTTVVDVNPSKPPMTEPKP